MNGLGWQNFKGTVHEYRATRNRIMDGNGNLREEFLGMDGYAAFAKEYYESRMLSAFVNISAVFSKREIDELGWQQFQGTVAEYHATRNRIMDETGSLRGEFLGMDGYAAFAEKYYESMMHPAFINTSAALSKREMDRLGWQGFQGTAHEYRATKNRIMDERGNLREEFLGMDGYAAFAEKIHESKMQKAFQNISAVLGGRKEMKRSGLGWKVFFGSSSQYHELIEFFR